MKFISTLVILLFASQSYAQQFNHEPSAINMGLLYNPSFNSFMNQYEVGISARTQWIGLDNSPSNFSLFGSTKITNTNMAAGAYVFHDSFDPLNISTIGSNFSYELKGITNNDGMISLGIGIKAMSIGLNSNNLIARDDDAFEAYLGATNSTAFDVDFGFHFNSKGNNIEESYFTIGIAAQNLISQFANGRKRNNEISLRGSYNAVLSYNYVDFDFVISPTLWVNRSQVSPNRILAGFNTQIYERYISGLFYSNENTLYATLGYVFKNFVSRDHNLKILAYPNYYLGSTNRGSGVSFDISVFFSRDL